MERNTHTDTQNTNDKMEFIIRTTDTRTLGARTTMSGKKTSKEMLTGDEESSKVDRRPTRKYGRNTNRSKKWKIKNGKNWVWVWRAMMAAIRFFFIFSFVCTFDSQRLNGIDGGWRTRHPCKRRLSLSFNSNAICTMIAGNKMDAKEKSPLDFSLGSLPQYGSPSIRDSN